MVGSVPAAFGLDPEEEAEGVLPATLGHFDTKALPAVELSVEISAPAGAAVPFLKDKN